MNGCHFCKDELTEDNEYKIVAPDGKELYLCNICMSDVCTFFKTGRAEAVMLKQQDLDNRPTLSINRSAGEYLFSENTPFGTRLFKNVYIKDIRVGYGNINGTFLDDDTKHKYPNWSGKNDFGKVCEVTAIVSP